MFTDIENLLSQFDLDAFIRNSKEHIIIDAGHTSLGSYNGGYTFGHNKINPSPSEENTLRLAFELANKLKENKKECTVNICLSDTTKNFEKIQERDNFKYLLNQSKLLDILPKSYINLILEYKHIYTFFCLQTQLSNLSSRVLKSLKKKIKKINDCKLIYNDIGAFFIKDKLGDNFGLVHPYVLDNKAETKKLGGNWWLDEECSIHPIDLVSNPLLKVKKNKAILLYSKTSGILCPGTYAGLIFNISPNADFLSIYSRDDDPAIGEKINSGVIAALTVLGKLQSNCTQFVLTSGMKKCEISEIKKSSLLSYKENSWEKFKLAINEKGILDKYQSYI